MVPLAVASAIMMMALAEVREKSERRVLVVMEEIALENAMGI